jgi:hypothetical protein
MRKWRRQRASEASELGELDPYLLSLLARLAAARGTGAAGPDEWVSLNQVAALCRQLADAAVETLGSGWDEAAEQRMLVERRIGPNGVEVRLTSKGREFMEPILG